MITKKIRLDTIEKVKKFVAISTASPCTADIVSGRHTVDAKSIMGIFSLNLTAPVELQIHEEDGAEEFAKNVAEFEA